MSNLATSINHFSMDLFDEIEKAQRGENILFPRNAILALGQLLLASNGKTSEEIKKVLYLDGILGADISASRLVIGAQCDRPGGDRNQLKAILSAINQHSKNHDLRTADRLFADKRNEILQSYLTCVKELYNAELQTVDFGTATDEARKEINAWVESQTNGKIKDMLSSGSVDSSASLIVVNAMNFKGKWKGKFDAAKTSEQPFWIDQNQSKNVPTMVQEGEFHLAEISDPPARVLVLPYDGEELSMVMLLPNDREGIDEIVKQMTYEKFQEWIAAANSQKTQVEISMPKFKLEDSYELKSYLNNLGMSDVFNQSKADLSGIVAHGSKLFVSSVSQQNYVEVNEEGVEATAAAGIEMSLASLPTIKFNHPFLSLIRDNKTGEIMSVAKISSPPTSA